MLSPARATGRRGATAGNHYHRPLDARRGLGWRWSPRHPARHRLIRSDGKEITMARCRDARSCGQLSQEVEHPGRAQLRQVAFRLLRKSETLTQGQTLFPHEESDEFDILQATYSPDNHLAMPAGPLFLRKRNSEASKETNSSSNDDRFSYLIT